MLTHVSTMANGSSRFSYTIDRLLQFQSHAVREDPSWKMSPQVTLEVPSSPIQTFNFIKNLAATPKDALLISVDFEGRAKSDNGTITKYPTEMGIATFDTRNVEAKSSDIDDIRAQKLLETFHYQSTKETERFYIRKDLTTTSIYGREPSDTDESDSRDYPCRPQYLRRHQSYERSWCGRSQRTILHGMYRHSVLVLTSYGHGPVWKFLDKNDEGIGDG
jgi:hypothetical protein